MVNYIIIGIIVVLILLSLRPTIAHFKGEGSCCGGGGELKLKKKRLSSISQKKVFKVDGMSCEHCKNRVIEAVDSIDGVAARVCLKKGEVTVLYQHEVDDETIKNKIEALGYTVSSCRDVNL